MELLSRDEVLGEALYDYTAQRDDELTFSCGDVIVITDRTSDPEWWRGHLKNIPNTTDALFPANYVRVR